jgi:cell division GTPase FtsZ
MQVAPKGIEELAEHVDSLITIPNEKLHHWCSAATFRC